MALRLTDQEGFIPNIRRYGGPRLPTTALGTVKRKDMCELTGEQVGAHLRPDRASVDRLAKDPPTRGAPTA